MSPRLGVRSPVLFVFDLFLFQVKLQDLDITTMLGTDQPEELVPVAVRRHAPTSLPVRHTSYSSTCKKDCFKCVRL